MRNTKIVINPKYDFLKDFITHLPTRFSSEGETIFNVRNHVKLFRINELLINVKRFCVPRFMINRIVYCFLRKSKAERAFCYAERLLAKGINTPEPIAYITEQCNGFFCFSYFISVHVPYSHCAREFSDKTMSHERELCLTEFGRFTAELHNKGVYHKDYSGGNILFEIQGGRVEFCLVDINRLYFGRISMKKGCSTFARLGLSPRAFALVSDTYAGERNFNPVLACSQVLNSRLQFTHKQKIKRALKHARLF